MFNLKTFVCFLLFSIVNIQCKENPSVIIVGAGAAGIAAASRLFENNITNVRILEAGSRIGGRLHSVHFGDSIVDLGGQWCHGEDQNVVYELVKDLNVLEPESFQRQLIYSSGEAVEKNFNSELYEIWENIYITKKSNASIGEYFTERYTETVTSKYKNDSRKLKIALEALETFLTAIIAFEGAFSPFQPSTDNDYHNCEGEQHLSWNGNGYKTVLDVMMKKYPNPKDELPVMNSTNFNKPVVEITWNGDATTFNQVTVICEDGSEYKADHVIVTVSLGVLKSSYNTMFSPPLPTEKVTAITELGMGAVGKIFLYFPNQWWAEYSIIRLDFIWSENDIQHLSNSSYYWLQHFLGVHTVTANPNVLAAWFAGEFVKDIEYFSNDKLVDGIMLGIHKFLGPAFRNITEPNKIRWHPWYSNNYFRGTYSFQTPESRKRDVSEEMVLSQPLISNSGKPTVLFAGEASHPRFYSTVHGAIETGYREADRILDLAD